MNTKASSLDANANVRAAVDAGVDAGVEKFRPILEALCAVGRADGISMKPYDDPALPLFRATSPELQASAIELADRYLRILTNSMREDSSVVRNANTLWRMLGALRWRAAADLFPKIANDDVLEIYDRAGVQLYRSYNFFPLCTYTMEQIYSMPWFDLYHRDEVVMQETLAAVRDVLDHPEKGTRPMAMSEASHEVSEKKTPVSRCTLIQPRLISPLYDGGGAVVGFFHSFRALRSEDKRRPF